MATRQLLSPAHRLNLKICCLLTLFLLLGFAATIPYIWESKSIWYKTGLARTLLQMAKVCGLLAAVLFFLQVILAQRLVILDRIYGLDRIYLLHRRNGLLILGLAIVHALLVLIPEGIENLPIGWKFWPEMLGAALIVLLVFFVGTASFRPQRLPYHLWRKAHRPTGYLLTAMLAVHIFCVSDSFESGAPRIALWILIAIVLLVSLMAKLHLRHISIRNIPVQNCRMAGRNILALQLHAPAGFSYAPGQFGFLQLHGDTVTREAHPFTIASAPGNAESGEHTLEFYIKQCGDWTSSIRPGTELQATLQAPFGLFSYKARPLPPMLIYIGGGIGITPLLSMLRQLSVEEEPPATMLIWSLGRREEMFLAEELGELESRLPNLHVHIVYTREKGGSRIDKEQLASLLQDVPHGSHVYICGRLAMMHRIRGNLLQLHFNRKTIFRELFAL